ncbi:Serine/threonine-protein phosphatase PP1 isozyme 2 [Platanthera guangdongensis]|uniref:Serine/threonine-protein phosphatase PP1 isozyme 2 n=1 Tax=Platanthera guangdongensis TaxID=2320717 RepID=A0ABR2LLI5_9ASPA
MAAVQGQGIDPALLDDIINHLLEVRSARPGKQVQLSEAEIRFLRRWQRGGGEAEMAAVQGQGIDPALLDDIINRLLEVRSARPGKQVQLSEAEILCSGDEFVGEVTPGMRKHSGKVSGSVDTTIIGVDNADGVRTVIGVDNTDGVRKELQESVEAWRR